MNELDLELLKIQRGLTDEPSPTPAEPEPAPTEAELLRFIDLVKRKMVEEKKAFLFLPANHKWFVLESVNLGEWLSRYRTSSLFRRNAIAVTISEGRDHPYTFIGVRFTFDFSESESSGFVPTERIHAMTNDEFIDALDNRMKMLGKAPTESGLPTSPAATVEDLIKQDVTIIKYTMIQEARNTAPDYHPGGWPIHCVSPTSPAYYFSDRTRITELLKSHGLIVVEESKEQLSFILDRSVKRDGTLVDDSDRLMSLDQFFTEQLGAGAAPRIEIFRGSALFPVLEAHYTKNKNETYSFFRERGCDLGVSLSGDYAHCFIISKNELKD